MAPQPSLGRPSRPTAHFTRVPCVRSGGGGEGGGGGDGDGAAEWLRLLGESELTTVLNDWSGRSRVYRMTDNHEVSQAHSRALSSLELLRTFNSTPMAAATADSPAPRKMVLGLFDQQRIWALASAHVSRASGLVVSSVSVYPAELHNDASTAELRMVS